MIEAPEAPHHHHHKTGLPWFDLIVPVAVLCISVASLLTSLQSEKSMHALVEQNTRLVSAQSTPLLMLDTGNLDDNGKAVLSMTISNVGTGPAQIAWFRVVDAQGQDFLPEPSRRKRLSWAKAGASPPNRSQRPFCEVVTSGPFFDGLNPVVNPLQWMTGRK